MIGRALLFESWKNDGKVGQLTIVLQIYGTNPLLGVKRSNVLTLTFSSYSLQCYWEKKRIFF